MLAAQRTRRWIWRLNGVLAVLVLAAWALAATENPAARVEKPPSFDALWPEEVEAADVGGPVSDAEFEAFGDVLRRFHPPAPEPPSTVVASVPTRPPLSAFRVLLAIERPDRPSLLAIECKDPSHPDVYYLTKDAPDRDAEITHHVVEDKVALFTVARGEESFVFRVPLGKGGGAAITGGIIRVVPETTTAPAAHGLARPGERPERMVKLVPYQTTSGESAVRVTGIKPGSALADLGLEAGDVIQRVDSEVVDEPGAFLDLVARGHVPRSITVLRGVASRAEVVELGDA